MTSVTDISNWFDRGVAQGAHFMIVAMDGFDYEDYPVYITSDSEAEIRAVEKRIAGNSDRVMEVYSLRSDKKSQLDPRRYVFHRQHFTL